MRGERQTSALFSLLVVACTTTSDGGVREQLDERTGVTVTSLVAPLEFFSPLPERGLQAASFAYLGPIEINQMGAHQNFLWLSVLLGADGRVDSTQPASSPPQLRITAEGVTIEPVFVSTDARQVGLGRQVYERPARWVGEAFYSVTTDEIAQLAAAGTLTLEISAGDGASRRYEAWKPDFAGLRRFAERISATGP